jgi:hypothetical protein
VSLLTLFLARRHIRSTAEGRQSSSPLSERIDLIEAMPMDTSKPVVSMIDEDVSVREPRGLRSTAQVGRQNEHPHASLRAQGAIACLAKPFDDRTLLQAVSAAPKPWNESGSLAKENCDEPQ